MKKIIILVLKFAAVVLCAAGILFSNLTTTPNVGNFAGTLLFGALLLCVIFFGQLVKAVRWLWKRKIGQVAVCVFGTIAAAGIGLCVFFSVNMAVFGTQDVSETDCVIVLGCQVRGEEPGRMLTRRLNKALELLEQNPEAVCVCSGGRGADEQISEAEAMKRWLMTRGIAKERIFTESRSTSTEENMRLCAEIIREREIEGRLTVVTSEFHQYRAHIYARRAGLEVTHASAATGSSLLNSWIREWLALAASFFA